MRIQCLHGFFIFSEDYQGDISDFITLTGLPLVPYGKEKEYTFERLAKIEDYSLLGKKILEFPAIKTFSGKPWEVFEANGVVYDFSQDLIVPITSIVASTEVSIAGNAYLSNGLLLPGHLVKGKGRVKNYDCHYTFNRGRWLYTEVTYV
ncbi:hypothetical protein BdPhPhi1402_gp27 [Bdellovibrio phage phi1402]|uniref:hypothetical protein n=1 Tax=Bdellovibrio phage phi1402 TaxID=1035662 RepID=UPI000211A2D9|nr:hypothetical protein BdPhPhi1402_gp27 [Bdellovibrio phage phi1402]AEG42324.1 hypothetical protein [Bdellovibrio phage phi1402]